MPITRDYTNIAALAGLAGEAGKAARAAEDRDRAARFAAAEAERRAEAQARQELIDAQERQAEEERSQQAYTAAQERNRQRYVETLAAQQEIMQQRQTEQELRKATNKWARLQGIEQDAAHQIWEAGELSRAETLRRIQKENTDFQLAEAKRTKKIREWEQGFEQFQATARERGWEEGEYLYDKALVAWGAPYVDYVDEARIALGAADARSRVTGRAFGDMLPDERAEALGGTAPPAPLEQEVPTQTPRTGPQSLADVEQGTRSIYQSRGAEAARRYYYQHAVQYGDYPDFESVVAEEYRPTKTAAGKALEQIDVPQRVLELEQSELGSMTAEQVANRAKRLRGANPLQGGLQPQKAKQLEEDFALLEKYRKLRDEAIAKNTPEPTKSDAVSNEVGVSYDKIVETLGDSPVGLVVDKVIEKLYKSGRRDDAVKLAKRYNR